MPRKREIYLSRTGAYLALAEKGRRKGLTSEFVNVFGRVNPEFKRGALQGWSAWLEGSPILEGEDET